MLIGRKQQLVNKYQCNYLSEDNIYENLEKFCQIDTYGTLPKFNPVILPTEQKKALHILESTTVIKDKKFEVDFCGKKRQYNTVIQPRARRETAIFFREEIHKKSHILNNYMNSKSMTTLKRDMLRNYQKMNCP